MKIPLMVLLLLLLPYAALAVVICEDLPVDLCAFSISSTGKRCLLETNQKSHYDCRASDVTVERVSNWIESDDCVKICAVDRTAVGISSDALLDPRFTASLCSSACYQNCPNIVDLYTNLAAAEGVLLSDLCEARRSNPYRSMAELLNSGAASGPSSAGLLAGEFAIAPSPA